MKRKLAAILAGLLVLTCLAASCTFTPVEDSKIPMLDLQNTTAGNNEASTQAPVVPSNPADLIGKWKSSAVPMMFQFFSDNTLKCYYLTPGYYEYEEVHSGTYSYDGITLQYKLSDGSELNATCSVASGKMTINTQYAFEPVDSLPTEHPVYTFPDFEAIAIEHPLDNGTYTGIALPETFRAETLKALEATYWNGVSQTEWKKLTAGTAKLGDIVNIDYEGKLDGVAFTGGTATNQVVEVNDGTGMIDGFCVGINGHSVGETFDVNVTFPENYHSADLAGKAVVFTMKLNAIYDLSLSDEIAKKNNFDSLEKWLDSAVEAAIKKEIWSLIPAFKSATVPATASAFFVQYYLDMVHQNAFYYFNNDLEACLSYMGMTMETLQEEAVDAAKTYLISAQLIAHYRLTPDEEHVKSLEKSYIDNYVQSGYSEEEARALLEGEGKTEFRGQILIDTAIDYLIANNFQ